MPRDVSEAGELSHAASSTGLSSASGITVSDEKIEMKAQQIAHFGRLVMLLAVAVGATEMWFERGLYAAERITAGLQTISTDELAHMLEQKDFELINVHIPYEGEIGETDAFIPFDEIEAHLDMLPADRGARIVLYCKSGRMSEIAGEKLASLGFTNVSHVVGGFVAWAAEGRELLTVDRVAKDGGTR